MNLAPAHNSQMLFAEEILYIWMQFAIKQAFLLFYLRLTKQTFFIYSVYATMALNIAIAVALWLVYCLQCQPLAAFWNKMAYPDAKCLDTAITYYVPVALVSSLVHPIPLSQERTKSP